MQENGHRRDFRLRYNEVNNRAELTPVALLDILEETASSHCDEAGWGVFRLMNEGYGWILLRGGFEMLRYPGYREDFYVETWISKVKRFEAFRENRVVATKTGEVLGTARALWLFYDIAKRRPATIFDDIVKVWTPGGPDANAQDLSEVEGPNETAQGRISLPDPDFAVRKSDIDTNGHVNNVVYLNWALEAVPKEVREEAFLSSLRGQFKHELRLGSNAEPICCDEGNGRFRLGVIGRQNAGEQTTASSGSAHSPETATQDSRSYLAAAAESLWLPRSVSAGQDPSALRTAAPARAGSSF